MNFEVTGIGRNGAIDKRLIENTSKHEIEQNKLKYGFVKIINVKQKGN